MGHVGDANFHQAIFYNPTVEEQVAGVGKCVHDMIDKALEMEGTVSVGVGLSKFLDGILDINCM